MHNTVARFCFANWLKVLKGPVDFTLLEEIPKTKGQTTTTNTEILIDYLLFKKNNTSRAPSIFWSRNHFSSTTWYNKYICAYNLRSKRGLDDSQKSWPALPCQVEDKWANSMPKRISSPNSSPYREIITVESIHAIFFIPTTMQAQFKRAYFLMNISLWMWIFVIVLCKCWMHFER